MKNIIYLLIFFVPISAWSLNANKEIEKNFAANGITELRISNDFGDINLVPSLNDSITITATLVADVIEMSDTNDIFRYIETAMYKSKNTLRIKTTFNPALDNSTLAGVHYTIQIPDSLNLSIQNRYGNVSLFNIFGTKNIDLKYGKLTCQNLLGPKGTKSSISLTFADLTAEKSDSLELNLDNASVKMKEIRGCKLTTSYSVFEVANCRTLHATSQNDKLTLNSVDHFYITATNTIANLHNLNSNMEADFTSGSLSIQNLSKQFNGLNLSLHNSEAAIQTVAGSDFLIHASVQYGTTSFPTNFKITTIRDVDKTIYKGFSVSENAKAQMGIVSYNSTLKIK